jgi:septal ring factor EnvC (AmiA/AmiB activator)
MRLLRLYRFFGFLAVILALSVLDTEGQSRQNLEEQRKKTLQEINETNRFLGEVQQSQKGSLEKFNLLSARVVQYNRLINGLNAEIGQVDRKINESSAKVRQMSNEVEKLKVEYAQLVYHAYTNKGKYNKLIYVLTAKDFNEAYRRMNYFRQYSEYRKRQVSEITKAQEELNEATERLAAEKAEKEKLLAEQRNESKQLEAAKAEQDKEVNNLKSQERKLRKQLTEQQRKAQQLQREVEKIIAAEAKKRKAATSAGKNSSGSANLYDKLTPEERVVSKNFKDNKGRLPWHVEKGIITGYFGLNAHPFLKDIKIDSDAIDITTVGGASVRAVFDGEVTLVSGILGGNISVLVRHGNFISVYQNLVDVSVKQGDKVKIKETIGKVYTEKDAKTAVLRFGIWEEAKKQNPELWIMKM